MFKSRLFTMMVVYSYSIFCFTTPLIPQEPFRLIQPQVVVSQIEEEELIVEPEPDFSLMPLDIVIPTVTIVGGEQPIEIGELIQLKAEINSDESINSLKYSWTVLPDRDITVWPDGSKILFGTGTKHDAYIVVLTVSFVFAELGPENEISIQQKAVTLRQDVQIIRSILQTETSESTPITTNFLRPLSGISENAYELVKSIERNANYTDEDVKRDATNLFAAFTSVASDIELGILTDLNAVLETTIKRNAGVLDNKKAWGGWFDDISNSIEILYNDGKLEKMSEITQIWRDIAKGLIKASK